MRNIFKRFQINKTRTHFAYRLFSYFTIMSVFYSEQKQRTRSNGNLERIRIDPESLLQFPTHSPAPPSPSTPRKFQHRSWHSDTDNTAQYSLLTLLNMFKLVWTFHCHWSSSRLIKCQAEDEACECPGPDIQRDWAWSWSASDHTATLDKVSRGVKGADAASVTLAFN